LAGVPGIAVNGYFCFDHHIRLPEGQPEREIDLDNILSSLRHNKTITPKPLSGLSGKNLCITNRLKLDNVSAVHSFLVAGINSALTA
jgi:hypothetical protein